MKLNSIKILISFLLLLTGSAAEAQKLEWVKPILAYDNFNVVTQNIPVDKAGNIYVITNLDTTGVFGKDTIIPDSPSSLVLAKYDTSGVLLKTITVRKPFTRFYVRDMNFDDAGNIYLSGEFITLKENSFIIKCDSNGRILWSKVATSKVAGQTVTLDGKGNIFTGGYIMDAFLSDTFKFKPKHTAWNSFVTRMDTSGKIQWIKFFYCLGGGSMPMAHTHGNLIGLNGSLYVAGHFTRDGYIDTFSIIDSTSGNTGMLMNLDTADGRVRFLVKDTGATFQKFYIYQDKSGDIFTSGLGYCGVNKFSEKGLILPYKDSLRFTSIVYPTTAGVNYDGQVLTTYRNGSGFSVRLTDNTGKTLGSENYKLRGLYSVRRIVPCGKHQFYIYGSLKDTFGYNGDTLKALLHLYEYQFIGKITIPQSMWASVNNESSKDESSLQIYPNPNDGNFTFLLKDRNQGNITVSIYDITGKVVYSSRKESLNSPLSVVTKNLCPGQYILRIQTSEKVISRKIIVN